MKDEEIDFSDCPEMDEEFFKQAKIVDCEGARLIQKKLRAVKALGAMQADVGTPEQLKREILSCLDKKKR